MLWLSAANAVETGMGHQRLDDESKRALVAVEEALLQRSGVVVETTGLIRSLSFRLSATSSCCHHALFLRRTLDEFLLLPGPGPEDIKSISIGQF